jgi:proline utilization trans-activator
LRENERLQHRQASRFASPHDGARQRENESLAASASPSTTAVDSAGNDNATVESNQDLAPDSQSWFVDIDFTHAPAPINDATDTAFATRFRQVLLDPQDVEYKYIPRIDYAADELVMTLADAPCPWPTPSRARFLVEVALRFVNRCFHIVRRSTILDSLELSLSNRNWRDLTLKCKLWALFGIGELYSSRSLPPDGQFPGLPYFTKALRMLCYMSERPTLDLLEIRLLMSFYSMALNRRYAAYTLAGAAVRMAIIMGLHLNIPTSQLSDPAVREHRNRVWWTVYVFDRMWASKLGHPAGIHDDDIKVNFPSNADSDAAPQGDFTDAGYFAATSKLTRIVSRAIRSIYNDRQQTGILLNKIQQSLKDLTTLVDELPPHLLIDTPSSRISASFELLLLHLSLNQAIIVVTRPILLWRLRILHAAQTSGTSPQANQSGHLHQSVTTLSEACIRCARSSCHILNESWIQGSFPTFDHLLTQYLFSALTALAISSLLGDKDNNNIHDREQFEAAAQILAQLKDGGNFAAQEFYKHVEAINTIMGRAQAKRQGTTLQTSLGSPVPDGEQQPLTAHAAARQPRQTDWDAVQVETAEMALAEPSLQELLTQPVADLQFLESLELFDDSQGLYWPDFSS